MKSFRQSLAVIIVLAIILMPLSLKITFASGEEPFEILWAETYGFGTGAFGNSVYPTDDGGFIVAGYTTSTAGGDDVYLLKVDSYGDRQWEKTFGGAGNERAESVIQTSGGGYIIAGYSDSFSSGCYEVYIIMTDPLGNQPQEITIEGAGNSYAYSLRETEDGGFMVAGYSETTGSGCDILLAKINAGGELENGWPKTYGGSGDDYGYDVEIARDGSYVVVGSTRAGGAHNEDVYLLKVDDSGNMLWQRTFGGGEDDRGYAVRQDSDGGYIITGGTKSFGNGDEDIYLVKTDASGYLEWQRNIGSDADDRGRSVTQTGDGGYAILGGTASIGSGNIDMYMVKTDVCGNLQWDHTFGGSYQDDGFSLIHTDDEGYILAGSTNSFGSGGRHDVYLVRLKGNDPVKPSPLSWEKTFGEEGRWDSGRDILQTADGGFMVLAGTETNGSNGWRDDIWLLKTDYSGNIQWHITLGGEETWDYGHALEEAPDGAYIIVGSSIEDDDSAGIYLAKVSDSGSVVWERTFRDTSSNNSFYGYSVSPVADGGYFIVGETYARNSYVYLLKTDDSGNFEWDKTLTRSSTIQLDDSYRYSYGLSGVQDSDGGYSIITAYSTGILRTTVFLLKTDSSGELQWSKPLVSGLFERAVAVTNASDGGYIVSSGAELIKTDSLGDQEWIYNNFIIDEEEQILELDVFVSTTSTKDGDYITTGPSLEVDPTLIGDDLELLEYLTCAFFLTKLDNLGTLQWQRLFGKEIFNYGTSVRETTDGGLIAVGGTGIALNDTDVYLVRLDPGEFYDDDWGKPDSSSWPKTFGPGVGWAVLPDGDNYIVVGEKYSSSGDEALLFKTNHRGQRLWQNTFGTTYSDFPAAVSVEATADGGYIIIGTSDNYEAYLVKTGYYGELQWEQYYGEEGMEYKGLSARQTADGGYIVAGNTYDWNTGEYATFLIKTDMLGQIEWEESLSVENGRISGNTVIPDSNGYVIIGDFGYSNAGNWSSGLLILKTDQTGEELWARHIEIDEAHTFLGQPTSDGGYIIIGSTWEYDYELEIEVGEIHLVKTDALGMMQWHRTFGGDLVDLGLDVKQTGDGGYIIAGATTSFGNGSFDICLVKTCPLGNLDWQAILNSDLDEFGTSVMETSDGYVVTGARVGDRHSMILLTEYKPD